MNSPCRGLDELKSLLDALCEESITSEQVRRLEELVLSQPEAEAYYVQYLSLHADLSRHFAGGPAGPALPLRENVAAEPATVGEGAKGASPKPARAPRRLGRLFWGGLGLSGMAAGLLLALALWPRPDEIPQPEVQTPPAEASDSTVALLLQAHGAEWEDTGQATRVGSPLAPGWLRLKSGAAHIEFYSGASVILTGPAELKLISRMEVYCTRGKLRATVPPQAQGFTVSSPQVNLVDRGTEFGFEIGDRTEVHVFQGKVEVYDLAAGPKGAPQELKTGQGVRLQGPGGARAIQPNPAGFVTAQELAAYAHEELERRQREWQAAREALRRDPELLVYYTFEAGEAWNRTLPDQSRRRQRPHDGAIVGCTWGAGRWPGRQGLEFKQVSDRVRLHVPGELQSLTLMTWVRLDSLPNHFNSLFMPDGWDEGVPHWHIHKNGRIELGVAAPPGQPGAHYVTPSIFTPERLGQWVHLAVVYDGEAGQVTHYVDGQACMQANLRFDGLLYIGNAEIGNWNVGPTRHNHPIRYFRGCMDEFLLFSRPLGADEIRRHAEQGRPPL